MIFKQLILMNLLSKIINKEKLEFISNNLALIVAVPTVIGGIKQVHSLFKLSPILYKFFSFGQLIIDGFFVLIKLVIVYFFFVFYEIIVEVLTNPSGSQRKKNFKIFSFTLFIILYLILIVFMILRFGYDLDKSNYYVNILIYAAIILVALNLINLSIGFKKEGFFLFFLALLLGIGIFPEPNNSIENFTMLTKEVNKKYPKATLAYFNDQYIFYEISKDKYLVRKIDDLFEQDVDNNIK